MGERRGAYRVLVGKPEEENHLGDPGEYVRTTLKWIFEKWDGEEWIGSIRLRIGTGFGLLNAVMNFRSS